MNEQAWQELRRRYPWPKDVPEVPWDERHGWCAGPVRQYFKRFLSVETKLIIELGSWLGLSARYMMAEAPCACMTCVDHWKGSAEHFKAGRPDVAERLPQLYERFIRRMWEYQDRLVAMRQEIQPALCELAELGFQPDLIYVDGSHDSESVLTDIMACRKHFPNARLMGDDWSWASVRIGVWRTKLPYEHNEVAWAIKK